MGGSYKIYLPDFCSCQKCVIVTSWPPFIIHNDISSIGSQSFGSVDLCFVQCKVNKDQQGRIVMVKVVFKEDNLNFSSIDTSHFFHRKSSRYFFSYY